MIRTAAAAALALLFLAAAAALPGRGARAYLPPDGPLRGIGDEYLALGDSLATGVGSSGCPVGCAGSAGYVAQYARRLKQISGHAVSVRDLGVNGETTASFIGDFFTNRNSRSQLARAVAEIRRNAARLSPITLDIGGNDALAMRGPGHSVLEKQAALATARNNLEIIVGALLRALRDAHNRADLVLVGYYAPWGDFDPDAPFVAALNQLIQDIGAAHGLPVAQPYALFAGAGGALTWTDCRCVIDVHPNDRGYGLMSEAIAEVTYSQTRTLGALSGTVRATSGVPSAGATVWYGAGVSRTDAQGRFHFDRVMPGVPLRLVAEAPDEAVWNDAEVTALSAGETSVDITLWQGGAPVDAGYSVDHSHSPDGYARIAAAIGKASVHSAVASAVDKSQDGAQTAVDAGGKAAGAAKSAWEQLSGKVTDAFGR